MVRILGLDPGLTKTGWGVLDSDGSRLSHVANGTIVTTQASSMPERLAELDKAIQDTIVDYQPHEAAIEIIFLNVNAESTLKLAHARGVVSMVPARENLRVSEYGAKHIKKSIVGSGNAAKDQVQSMVQRLMPGVVFDSEDAADALAVAICHAHHRTIGAAVEAADRKQIKTGTRQGFAKRGARR